MSFIPSVLAVVSILCGCLMYYNMRRAVDLRILRANLMESEKVVIETPSNENSLVAELESSVRLIATESLISIKDNINELWEKERFVEKAFKENCWNAHIDDAESQLSIERINYADETLGARIEHIDEVPLKSKCTRWYGGRVRENPPENMLRSSMKPGCCYAFKHSSANVTIALAQTIFIDAFEIEHIRPYKSPTKETSSAPRGFKLYGISTSGAELYFGEYQFENDSQFQVYPVKSFSVCKGIRVQFISNHGNPYFTCVYRVAVYGKPYD